MARKSKVDPDDEREDDDDDEDEDVEAEAVRDFVMARLGAAAASLTAARNAVDTALECFVNPDSDAKGKERREAIEEALEGAGAAARALEAANEEIENVDFEIGEPWEDDES